VARVKAVLRRRAGSPGDRTIRVGGILEIDPDRRTVEVEGRRIDLTTTEFNILELLSSRKGWVFSRNSILEHLWKGEKIVLERTVDVHVRNIRKKLGTAGKFIKNLRGIGYKLEE